MPSQSDAKKQEPHRVVMRALIVAAFASILASVGDFLLLWVGNARLAEFDYALPGADVLLWGYYLGVLCIPFYAVGYWGLSRSFTRPNSKIANFMWVTGTLMAVLGGTIHGVTGISIAAGIRADTPAGDPSDVIFTNGSFLLPLWIVATVLFISCSASFSWVVMRKGSTLPRYAAFLNPLALTVIIVVAAMAFWLGQFFIIPAAPNLAHVLFFGWMAVLLSRDK